jgi:hypothetical protein
VKMSYIVTLATSGACFRIRRKAYVSCIYIYVDLSKDKMKYVQVQQGRARKTCGPVQKTKIKHIK